MLKTPTWLFSPTCLTKITRLAIQGVLQLETATTPVGTEAVPQVSKELNTVIMALLMPKFAFCVFRSSCIHSFLEDQDLPNGTLILAVEGRISRGRNEWGRMGSLANNTGLFEQQDIRRTASEAANTDLEHFACALRP